MPANPPPGPYDRLPARGEEAGTFNVVVETPRGSRHKYVYEEKLGLFALSGVLPAGAVFPYDFGFIPRTLAEDGDPLDVLLLLDDTAFVGCLVPARLIGAVEAEQTERDGEVVRNDRLIAVAADSYNNEGVTELEQLGESVLREIEHFFASYNDIKGKRFRPVGRADASRARALVEDACARFGESADG